MKQISKWALVVLLSLFLASCSSTGKEIIDNDDLLVVGFSQLGSESDWRVANSVSMRSALSEANGYELIFENARQKQENQLASLRKFVLQGADIIVVAPVSESGWDNALAEARDANIPVIVVDRSVSVEDDSLYLCRVGSDFLQEGVLAMQWLEREQREKAFLGDKLRILHLQGSAGATSQLMRTKALEDSVANHSNWEIVAQLPGDYTEAKAYEMVRDYVKADRSFDVIYSENDNMTFGALRALDEAGIPYGTDGGVKIISFDAVRDALQLCLDGKINLCVECNPLHGPRVDELIQRYLAGEEIPKEVYVEEICYERKDLTQKFIDERDY